MQNKRQKKKHIILTSYNVERDIPDMGSIDKKSDGVDRKNKIQNEPILMEHVHLAGEKETENYKKDKNSKNVKHVIGTDPNVKLDEVIYPETPPPETKHLRRRILTYGKTHDDSTSIMNRYDNSDTVDFGSEDSDLVHVYESPDETGEKHIEPPPPPPPPELPVPNDKIKKTCVIVTSKKIKPENQMDSDKSSDDRSVRSGSGYRNKMVKCFNENPSNDMTERFDDSSDIFLEPSDDSDV